MMPPTLTESRVSFIESLELSGRSPRTLVLYDRFLKELEVWLRENNKPLIVDEIQSCHIRGFLLHLARRPKKAGFQYRIKPKGGLAPETLRGYHRVLLSFFTWCEVEGLLNGHEPLRNVSKPSPEHKEATVLSDDEVWLEKDGLSGIFGQVLKRYRVTLNVGRGYDSWTSIQAAARRLDNHTIVLHFGDFAPSGEDMVRSLAERLAFFGCCPEIVKVALNLEDIERYDLPPDFAKESDSRRDAFVAEYGDVAVELDALPANVLAERLESAVSGRLDMGAREGGSPGTTGVAQNKAGIARMNSGIPAARRFQRPCNGMT